MSWRRRVELWAPVILYMMFIFYSSSRPKFGAVRWAPDPLLHFGGYLALGLLTVRAFAGGLPPLQSGLHPYLTGAAVAALYGVSDELHQSFVPGRMASGWDALTDAAGACAGALAVGLYAREATRP